MISRRHLVATAPALLYAPSAFATQSAWPADSQGIELSLAEIQTLYEEMPPGQGYRGFIDATTGAEMYFDFGDYDTAGVIWVYGEMTEQDAFDLFQRLCPKDLVEVLQFQQAESPGSISWRRTATFTSPSMSSRTPNVRGVLVTYLMVPAARHGEMVTEMTITAGILGPMPFGPR